MIVNFMFLIPKTANNHVRVHIHKLGSSSCTVMDLIDFTPVYVETFCCELLLHFHPYQDFIRAFYYYYLYFTLEIKSPIHFNRIAAVMVKGNVKC